MHLLGLRIGIKSGQRAGFSVIPARGPDRAYFLGPLSAEVPLDTNLANIPLQRGRSQHLPAVDYRQVVVNRKDGTIRFRREGVRIDLGGIAKGYAVDRSIELLSQLGIRHAMVNAGGDTRLLGDRDGRPWVVGIRDPRNERRTILRMPLEDESISTSGDYERYFEEDGVRYHHILEPGTGKAARGIRSVTVIGSKSIETDALSTSVFVLGIERGMQLVSRLPGFEAVIVDDQGEVFYSDGLTPSE